MASALDSLLANNDSSGSVNPVSWNDYYQAYKRQYGYEDLPGYNIAGANGYDFWSRLLDKFDGRVSSAKDAYNDYLTTFNNTHAIRNQMADLKAAGVNPLTAIIGSGVSASASSAQSYAQRSSEPVKRSKSGSLVSSALKLLAILALKG